LKESSTRLSLVFTDCPPGPEDLENRHDSSSARIVLPLTTIGSVTPL
jgi:hypothetical protein